MQSITLFIGTIDLPTKDKFEDTPLTLAVKNVPQKRNSSNVSVCLSISIQIVQKLLEFGKLELLDYPNVRSYS